MSDSKEWLTRGLVLGALAATIGLPFLLRPKVPEVSAKAESVVIISPHNEAIRSEFGRAFTAWYKKKTGKTVVVDWRVIGGTSEITKYLSSEYTTAFQYYWTSKLGRKWSVAVQGAFDNPRLKPDATPADDTVKEAARRAFLKSNVGCGIDLFFGGGSFDFAQQDAAGRLVPSGIHKLRPEWFTDSVIPQIYHGEEFWAKDDTWIGTVLSSFGILYNRDALRRLGLTGEIEQWSDLDNPKLFGEVALADPTKSGSIAKAFEMVIQQQILDKWRALQAQGMKPADCEARAVREGWVAGMRVLQLAGANARYFTDTSQKPPIDVGQGDAAVGMCIDFYGRFQAESVVRRDAPPRLRFVTPPGGSVYSVDPVAELRGSPHPKLALAFIEFVLSPEGQKLWNDKPGTPGGPKVYSLRRLPVRKDFYNPATKKYRADPDVDPYSPDNDFYYHPEWTARLFSQIGFLTRVMCMDTHDSLAGAWRAIVQAGFPKDALDELQNMSFVDYAQATGPIRKAMSERNSIEDIRLARELGAKFRAQYRKAEELARAHERH